MTVAQWLFHYFEIMKQKKEDVNIISDLLKYNFRSISEDIDLLGLIINPDTGKSMIEIKRKYREENVENENKKAKVSENDSIIDDSGILTSEDKELLDFFNSVPDVMTPTQQQANIDKYCLPTVDIKEKMKLGFEEEQPDIFDRLEELDKKITELEKIKQSQISDIQTEFDIVDDVSRYDKPQLGFDKDGD